MRHQILGFALVLASVLAAGCQDKHQPVKPTVVQAAPAAS
jgi:hypothetical protein